MPSDKSSWTVLHVLQWTTAFFESRHIDSPRLSAELLLAHALGTSRLELYLCFDQPLYSRELARYRELIKRRVQREPDAYITGRKAFWDLSLAVTPAVLIPRPDTECLVESALELLAADDGGRSFRTIWEPATGSGAVILALAQVVSEARLLASDNSSSALQIARANARDHHLADRVEFFASDWFAALRPAGLSCDLMVVNPPYIASDMIDRLAPEIHAYEPRAALDGGPDGLLHIGHILCAAADFLRPEGWLLMEIGWDQKDRVGRLAAGTGKYEPPEFVQDLAGHERVVRLRKPGR